ncbi:uncharacterized protein LOC141717897 [Apium graveolens]|uniref:uncharacterized protein LOC141717897 n=1 Tax=Apium graveolens TaxID=4045 RepID=UPI003D7A88D9
MSMNELDVNVIRIKTHVLKVHIHCLGCKRKVKKLLKKIEGVYAVNIDLEQQKVTVSGIVDPLLLIKILAKSGKYAELWSSIPNPEETHLFDNWNNRNSPQSQMLQSLIQDLRGPNYRIRTEPLRNSDQSYANLQQSFEIGNLNEGQVGQNNLPLEWNEQMLAAANGSNSMSTNMNGCFAAADGNEIGGLHNMYSGIPASYGANYHPSMMMVPDTLGYPYSYHPSPMTMNAADWRNTNMMLYDGGYMYQPQTAAGFFSPASHNYY